MSGSSNPGDRTNYTNSYTTAIYITTIVGIMLQVTRAAHSNYITLKDAITMIMAIADIDVSFQKNKWGKEGGIEGTKFFDRLGTCYKDLRQRKNVDVYHDIRCGLAHAYLI